MHICIHILAQDFISHAESPNGQFLPQPWSQVESLKMSHLPDIKFEVDVHSRYMQHFPLMLIS